MKAGDSPLGAQTYCNDSKRLQFSTILSIMPGVLLDGSEPPCLTLDVLEAITHAAKALQAAADRWNSTGFTHHMASLVREVWTTNLERFEPDELGDNARTLGFQCSENLCARTERRIRGDEHEAVHWNVPGLTVSRPNGSMRICIGGDRVFLMKAPMEASRQPRWDAMSWDGESATRQALAERNSRALGGLSMPAAGQGELFDLGIEGGYVDSYLMVWAGEISSGLTAGWLTIPILGELPFAAVTPLWWDEIVDAPAGSRRTRPDGPSFDQMASTGPKLRLKPRPAARGDDA